MYPRLSLSQTVSSNYAPRTIENATSADLTLYFHAPGVESSSGRTLTESHSNRFLPIVVFDDPPIEAANRVLEILQPYPFPVINIAGNRQHKFGVKRTQSDVTKYVLEVLTHVTTFKKIHGFRTGGQTGADWGGLIAGVLLDVPTVALFPAGFRQQYMNRKNIDHTQDEILAKIKESVDLLSLDSIRL